MAEGEIILYTTEDGATQIQLRAVDGSAWMTQREIAALFDKDVRTVNEHIRNIFEERECDASATIRKFRIVQTEGARSVAREVETYHLDVILAIGYRVRSERGVQFRRWATTVLREYLVKGFAMNDERLKEPAFDYFDELLARIRDIRASEARFYQKVRDILALSVNYDAKSIGVNTFYATIQNKMLYSVTELTAAEIISTRSDEAAPNMGLTSWRGRRVRKSDVTTAKNYLSQPEVAQLNLIVETFLNTAELRATRRQTMYLAEWEQVLDSFLASNELPLLRNAGSISADQAHAAVEVKYEKFDLARRTSEASRSPGELEELKRIADAASAARIGPRRNPKRGGKR